jgi:hypothetical protein
MNANFTKASPSKNADVHKLSKIKKITEKNGVLEIILGEGLLIFNKYCHHIYA